MTTACEHVAVDGLRAAVYAALEKAVDPCSVAAGRPMNLVEMGLVEQVQISDDGEVTVRLNLTSPSCMMLGQITEQIDEHVMPLLGGTRPRVTSDDGMSWTPDRITGAARRDREQRRAVLVQLAASRR